MSAKRNNTKIIGAIAVTVLLVFAGCVSPPSPPDRTTETPTPETNPYVESGAEITFEKVQPDHYTALTEDYGSFATSYTVNISDPRLNEEKSFTKRYLFNTNTSEVLYESSYTSQQQSIYQNTLLQYRKTGDETEITPVSEVTDQISQQEAAANSSLIRVGMNSATYTLESDELNSNGVTTATYTATQDVSNYALQELIPDDLDYTVGNPSTTNEEITTTIVMRENGIMNSYTFTYTADIVVNGNTEEYEFSVTYNTDRVSTYIEVTQPPWTQNQDGQSTNQSGT